MEYDMEYGQRKKSRLWSNSEEKVFLDIWFKYAEKLRKTKRTLPIYISMAQELNSNDIKAKPVEVQRKVNNLIQKYRKEKSEGKSEWKNFEKIDSAIGKILQLPTTSSVFSNGKYLGNLSLPASTLSQESQILQSSNPKHVDPLSTLKNIEMIELSSHGSEPTCSLQQENDNDDSQNIDDDDNDNDDDDYDSDDDQEQQYNQSAGSKKFKHNIKKSTKSKNIERSLRKKSRKRCNNDDDDDDDRIKIFSKFIVKELQVIRDDDIRDDVIWDIQVILREAIQKDRMKTNIGLIDNNDTEK